MSASPSASLWDFSLAYYRQPGVEAALLALQDERGVDVCLLLAFLWLDYRGIIISARHSSQLGASISAWQRQYTAGLRELRRRGKRLKEGYSNNLGGSESEELYTALKVAELQAEHVTLAWLQERIGDLSDAGLLELVPPLGVTCSNGRAYLQQLETEAIFPDCLEQALGMIE